MELNPRTDQAVLLPKVDAESSHQAVSLSYKASAIVEAFQDRMPNARELEEMTASFGIEIVSMALVKILAQITPNRYFYEKVETEIRSMSRIERSATGGLLESKRAGAALHDRYELCVIESSDPYSPDARWGAHVEQWRSWGRKAGFTTEVIQTDRRRGLLANAKTIRQELAAQPHDRRILATIGQGGAEVRLMLEHVLKVAPEELDGLKAWVNVAGLIRGASAIEMRRRHFWNRQIDVISNLILGRPRSLSQQLSSANIRLRQETELTGLPLICVSLVGMPRVGDVPIGLKQSFLKMAELNGPNDGIATFHQSVVRPGYIIPIPGMSHGAEGDRLAPWFIGTLQSLVDTGTWSSTVV